MPEVVDNGARDSIKDLDARLTEVQTILYGPNKDNGMKHELGSMSTKLSETRAVLFDLKRKCERYLEVDREKSCLGLKALAAYENGVQSESAEEKEDENDMKIAETQANAMVESARISARAAMTSQWIVLIGVAASLAITLFTK